MNYRRVNIGIDDTDEETQSLLIQISKWHNTVPKLWIPNYEVSESDVKETIQKILDTKSEDLFIAIGEDNRGNVQGFIWGYKKKESKNAVVILSLYVTENYRKYGVATNLKMLLEEWCRLEGVQNIETTVHYNNHNMLELNQKLGYIPGMVNMTKKLI